MENKENIRELKHKFNSFGVITDRDMFKKLGITKEDDIRMIHAWVNYQSAFAYRDGFDDGQVVLKDKLIKIKKKFNKIMK